MAVVTTGFFDGVHLGHRSVIQTVVSSARERGEEAIVVTFWPHPRTVLQQDARNLRLLSTLEEKKEMLLSLGIDRVELITFTRSFAAMKGSDYLAFLRERFNASVIVMGFDNKVGSDGLGAKDIGGVIVVGETGNNTLSSTKIRKVLEEGRIEDANAMLGYNYPMEGIVVAGNRLGRTIGFPTANMQLTEPLKLIPGNGVYEVGVSVLGKSFRGMCNIGTRPTVGGVSRTVETHILDFDEDIYGLPIGLELRRRIRDERHFPSLDALRAQLEADRGSIVKSH